MKMPQKIYYLDDDPDDLEVFRDAARSLGHEVLVFLDAGMMLAALEKSLPTIIFLDIRMPEYEGETILQVIRKRAELDHIPIVMISGFNPKTVVREHLDAGANYLMKKPAAIADFKIALEQVLGIDWNNFRAYS